MAPVKRETKAAAKTTKTAASKATSSKAEISKEIKAASLEPAVKEEIVKETVPVEEVSAKETKPAAKKAPSRRTAAKAAEPEASVYIEYAGRQVSAKEILETAKAAFTADHKDTAIKTIEIYVKPEEAVAYYVVNGEGSEEYKVTL
ncbi:DUF6465 family protein [Lachnospiraceae bacterium 62-35]